MRWITPRQLALTYRIPWIEAERIVREEGARIRRHGRSGLMFAIINAAGLFWVAGGARWLFPELGRLALMGIELPMLLVVALTLALPRLFASDAILARAEALAATADRSEQLTLR
ncbi:MAG: hypothetical protein B7X33_02470 [Lysobacterales bacterium 13-68-4]|jgi:hypothetical protein|nr:MAG: hypothetical protein B7X45_08660 [Xanthomonadales bacterium 15-68-25]OZB66496.1 MAG: hypothetical protein B7X39_10280 [Xanthomonadales bacterium 14-68-21]OZB70946.1 MAG: hypothetical protein B7X33_02470 [Xanthomonadales bacterium 13-68-4]